MKSFFLPSMPTEVIPIRVAGGDGVLYVERSKYPPAKTYLAAVMTYPDTVIMVITTTSFDASSKTPLVNPPDLNPLTDVDLFVSILEQHLRPYPD